ncbi:hypothetical protein VSU19_16800 [Verrucomicrobiales bacterium BCK34]|nr:hypothetical protein [Verrucomicrobiales bacterium BCK34]
MKPLLVVIILSVFTMLLPAEEILGGVAKVDITRPGEDAGENPLWAKALVLSKGDTHVVIVSVDAVAIAEIGSIRDPYLANVRASLQKSIGVPPESIVINASHCHGIVALDVEARTVEAVTKAWNSRVPVNTGVGSGTEAGISINRRLQLKSGKQGDVRHAYSLPNDDEVAAVGPIDPEIGILRVDKIEDGDPLALVYNFACHPIMGIPGGGNTADLSGFASNVIESHWGDGNAMALFVQGCGGDINPVLYKSVTQPHDGKPLGTRLGLSVLEAARQIETQSGNSLSLYSRKVALPRANLAARIVEMEEEIDELLISLKGTTLNFETFLPLFVKYQMSGEYPSATSYRYLQDELLKRDDWKKLDSDNRKAMDAYLANIRSMEELTRKQINLALIRKHQARNEKAGKTVEAEVVAVGVGDFKMITFPAELTVPIGLNIKKRSPHQHTFVAGYTNGYLYYAPTAIQLENRGGAQEDSDCLFAPEWQSIFEDLAISLLEKL